MAEKRTFVALSVRTTPAGRQDLLVLDRLGRFRPLQQLGLTLQPEETHEDVGTAPAYGVPTLRLTDLTERTGTEMAPVLLLETTVASPPIASPTDKKWTKVGSTR